MFPAGESPLHTPDLSICIVNWNTRGFLEQCLESIFTTVLRTSFEVIVLDNHSYDGSSEMVAEKFPSVRLIRNAVNSGLARGNNQAFSEAKGRFVLFLNPDTKLGECTVDELVLTLGDHHDLGIISCIKDQPDKGSESIFKSYPIISVRFIDSIYGSLLESAVSLFPQSRIIAGFRVRNAMRLFEFSRIHGDTFFDVDMVWGSFLLTRAEVVHQLKGFDERFFYGIEDKDFCHRAKKAGWRICLDPRYHIDHYKGQAILQWRSESMESMKVFSRLLLYRKHLGLTGCIGNFFQEMLVVLWRSFLDALSYPISILVGRKRLAEPRLNTLTSLRIMAVNLARVCLNRSHPANEARPFFI